MKENRLDGGKLEAVQLSDDALEGVNGGDCVVVNGVRFEVGSNSGSSGSSSTPKPSTQGGTLTLNGIKDSNLYGEGYVGPFNTCSNFRASRSTAAGGLHTCGNCVFFAEVSGQTGGYCCYPSMARS